MSINKTDVGTIIEVQILENNTPVNIGSVTDFELHFSPPSGAEIVKKKSLGQITLYESGTTGKVRMTVPSGMWTVAGLWNCYPVVIWETGVEVYIGSSFSIRII